MSECSLEDFAAQFWQSSGKDKHGAIPQFFTKRTIESSTGPRIRRRRSLVAFYNNLNEQVIQKQKQKQKQTPQLRQLRKQKQKQRLERSNGALYQSLSAIQKLRRYPASSHGHFERIKFKRSRVPINRRPIRPHEPRIERHMLDRNHQSDRDSTFVFGTSSIQAPFVRSFQKGGTRTMKRLRHLGYTNWVEFLSTSSSSTFAFRYLQSKEQAPFFLLLRLLRYNDISKEDFMAILVHTWLRLIGYQQKDIVREMSIKHGDIFSRPEWHVHPWNLPRNARPSFHQLDESFMMVLISRLLMQARRTLPQALPSIAHLFGSYQWFTKGSLEAGSRMNYVDVKTHYRLNKLYNKMVQKLSIPPSSGPAKNMRFAWEGQKILVEHAGRYNPPLLLNKDSYRAIIRVLGASRKSHVEKKFSGNIASSWPPWREEQDGVDAERPAEDDLSRSVLASRRMAEAGFRFEALDWEMLITGGRDFDGTPTISTRHVLNRSMKKFEDVRLWVARVRATRNAREAWMAFMEYDKQKKPVDLAMYHVIFEKLVFERLRLTRSQTSDALPGESKEVMQHAFQNLTADEFARTEPMKEGMLYSHMITSGLIPSGRLLDFLVRTAPSVSIGIQYLIDADLHQRALAVVLDCTNYMDRRLLVKIPVSTLGAFVRLLCRFTYIPPHTENHYHPSKHDENSMPQILVGACKPPIVVGVSKFRTPFHYAIQLVRLWKPPSPSIWYSLFSSLATSRVLVAAPFSGHPQDDVLSWHILKQLRKDFYACRLELDTAGFRHICACFEKALLSSWIPDDDFSYGTIAYISKNWKQEDFAVVKCEWIRLAKSVVSSSSTPRLLHGVNFAAIHTYVRVLGITRDWKGMVSVLTWMIVHREEMDEEARESGNGLKARRKVLIAMKCFIEEAMVEMEHEEDEAKLKTKPARRLVRAEEKLRELLDQEGLEEWGGWPLDANTRDYRAADVRFRNYRSKDS